MKYKWQLEAMNSVRKTNGCQETGSEWAKDCVLYPADTGAPVLTYIRGGGHEYPAEAPALTVKFFQEHSKAP